MRSPQDLAAAGLIEAHRVEALADVAERYAIAVTPHVAALIEPDAAADPIARQFVPSPLELIRRPGEIDDPIGDEEKSPVRGIVHRYPDRVLLKAVGICPVYCRFCFRREMVGPGVGHSLDEDELQAALDYIAGTPAIWEVIVTGGDPLILSPRRVADLTSRVSAIAHVKVLRWHSRVPVVSPQLITDDLAAALAGARPAVYVALHANHPRELSEEALAAIGRLTRAGIAMVSQTVLLAGINDDADTLEALMRGLVEARVKPYYLHHPDLAPGTGHFRVPITRGQELVSELRRRVSGLAMPTYVLDIPGGHGKVPLEPGHVGEPAADGSRPVRDRQGKVHRYLDSC